MKAVPKTEQVQIRVSPQQKRAIQRHAAKAGTTMSEWILAKVFPSPQAAFQDLVEALAASDRPSYVFAELLELLDPLSAEAFERVVAEPPRAGLDPYWQNYLAATVEHAASMKSARVPAWTRDVAPLAAPVFGSSLRSVRLHLLLDSPAPFAARNLFIDASVGARV
jgi:uncharacterized protein (DUF1778 family)